MTLVQETRAVLAQAAEIYRATADGARLTALRDRLDEPLRVAIVGRVKSGKSTLLNALVGERLAPTDAGECTRIVTWYRDGHRYGVRLHPRHAEARPAPFFRAPHTLEVKLEGTAPEDVAQLVVTWPSQALRTATLIDTPGIGSLSERVARRAWELLAEDEVESPADAVLYLVRHLHPHDLDFLRGFHDAGGYRADPVNAIGVLSRADEIAGGRLDAMASARRIAARLATDDNVRRLVQTVVPVAGLLAETSVTVTEAEVAQLRRIAALPEPRTDALTLTADRFVTRLPELGLTTDERQELLARFGLYGVRLTVALLRRGVVSTATDLAHELREHSGLDELHAVLDTLFYERRDVLKSRSALLALGVLTRTQVRPGSRELAARVERIVDSAHPFHELRVLSSLRAGWVRGRPEALAELERLIGGAGGAAHRRLQMDPDASPAHLTSAATAALARWQRRAENPLTGHELSVAARVAIRSCEGLIAGLEAPEQAQPSSL